jgi:hypothetical protein
MNWTLAAAHSFSAIAVAAALVAAPATAYVW